mmetsp:Transcript_32959/g.56335  ORF Transcript_32959/g.56335 Transcript_32959/m.56335 type:complete len:508 (+) Transcript_32959:907-2430(+)
MRGSQPKDSLRQPPWPLSVEHCIVPVAADKTRTCRRRAESSWQGDLNRERAQVLPRALRHGGQIQRIANAATCQRVRSARLLVAGVHDSRRYAQVDVSVGRSQIWVQRLAAAGALQLVLRRVVVTAVVARVAQERPHASWLVTIRAQRERPGGVDANVSWRLGDKREHVTVREPAVVLVREKVGEEKAHLALWARPLVRQLEAGCLDEVDGAVEGVCWQADVPARARVGARRCRGAHGHLAPVHHDCSAVRIATTRIVLCERRAQLCRACQRRRAGRGAHDIETPGGRGGIALPWTGNNCRVVGDVSHLGGHDFSRHAVGQVGLTHELQSLLTRVARQWIQVAVGSFVGRITGVRVHTGDDALEPNDLCCGVCLEKVSADGHIHADQGVVASGTLYDRHRVLAVVNSCARLVVGVEDNSRGVAVGLFGVRVDRRRVVEDHRELEAGTCRRVKGRKGCRSSGWSQLGRADAEIDRLWVRQVYVYRRPSLSDGDSAASKVDDHGRFNDL